MSNPYLKAAKGFTEGLTLAGGFLPDLLSSANLHTIYRLLTLAVEWEKN